MPSQLEVSALFPPTPFLDQLAHHPQAVQLGVERSLAAEAEHQPLRIEADAYQVVREGGELLVGGAVTE